MVNEAVIIELLGNRGDPVRYTVDNTIGVEKGTLMYMSDPRTALASDTTAARPFAGIAAAEKVANDGATTLALYTNGIFDILSSGAVLFGTGDLVQLSNAANVVQECGGVISGGIVVGQALEDNSASEVVAVKVKV